VFCSHPRREEGDGAVDPECFFDAGAEERKASEVVECGFIAAC